MGVRFEGSLQGPFFRDLGLRVQDLGYLASRNMLPPTGTGLLQTVKQPLPIANQTSVESTVRRDVVALQLYFHHVFGDSD